MRFLAMPLVAGALALGGCGTNEAPGPAAPDGPVSDGWLGRLDDHGERFRELERYLGGFSSAMWEVGERYERLHQALEADNGELAEYHWGKIRGAIRNGYRKRPGRQANADAAFLDPHYDAVRDALISGDAATAWAGFERAREACMACHLAEDVAFMNEQPMFTALRAPDMP